MERMGIDSETLSYEQYCNRRYFEPLDGLRAISILLVVSVHLNDNLAYGTWRWLRGEGGVGIFFILSGYLITTLALREEKERGQLSFRAFYARRIWRIFPAYYFFLAVNIVMINAVGSGAARDSFAEALPYYLTYMGEYAPISYFFQSWSLGVEEKFYLLWPVLCFALLRGRPRMRILGAAVLAFVLPLFFSGTFWQNWNTYPRVLFGCLLALVLADRRLYELLRPWAAGWRSYVALAAAGALHLASRHSFAADHPLEPFYTLAVGFVVLALVVGSPPWAKLLASSPMRYVGGRAYGIYLVQLACIWGVETFLPPSSGSLPIATLTYVLSFGLSLLLADVLYLYVERPGLLVGRRISNRMLAASERAPAKPVAA
jgi:peptidoglycan/LPS O-acetylase OafA/YrhL